MMSAPSTWAPAPGIQIEVLLEYPIHTVSAQHKCWKGGTVTAITVAGGKQSAEVELAVVGVLENHDDHSCMVIQSHGNSAVYCHWTRCVSPAEVCERGA
jgi:hypothetical protein